MIRRLRFPRPERIALDVAFTDTTMINASTNSAAIKMVMSWLLLG